MSYRKSKTFKEVADYAAEMKDSYERREFPKDTLHFFVDVFVEAYRRMPYTLGHIQAVFIVGAGLYLLFS